MPRLDWAEIVRLREVEGLSFLQIAQRMGKTKGAVYNAYRRAKAQDIGPSVEQEGKPLAQPKPEPEEAPESKGGEPEVIPKSEPEAQDARKLKGLLPDLDEMVSWWHKRKEALRKRKVSQARRPVPIPLKWLLVLLLVLIGLLVWSMKKRKSAE